MRNNDSARVCAHDVWVDYFENQQRHRFSWVGFKGPPIGYGLRRVEWSRDLCLGPLVAMKHLQEIAIFGDEMVTCSITSRDPKKSRLSPTYIWMQICRKLLEIETGFQRTTRRKWHTANRISTRSMTSRGPDFLFQSDYILTRHIQKQQMCMEKQKNGKYNTKKL